MPNGKVNIDYYRARLRCVRCHGQDAFTLNGRRLCADCAEKALQYSTRYGKEHSQERNAYKRERARKRKEAGLCPRCGKPVNDERVYCPRCRAWSNARRARQRREKNGVSPYYLRDGICYTCKRRPVMDGKKLCRECWEQSCRNLAKAREAQARTGANVWMARRAANASAETPWQNGPANAGRRLKPLDKTNILRYTIGNPAQCANIAR